MDDAPAVTVVIPTRNRRDLLLRTLDSALSQRGVDVVVVIVDDGGNDGTADAVRALHGHNVRLIRHEVSMGVSAARNVGLAVAETPWIAFVDDDDIWAPDKLQAQVHAIAVNGAAEWSCVGAVHIDSTMSILGMHEALSSGDLSSRLLRGTGDSRRWVRSTGLDNTRASGRRLRREYFDHRRLGVLSTP